MPRHAATRRRTPYRSPSAAHAHHTGTVMHTIDIARSPAFDVRQRMTAAAARNGMAMGLLAAMVWLFDLAEVIRH